MIEVRSVLRSLAKRRALFHSEADFQHELAWEIRRSLPKMQLRLEVPSAFDGVGTTDILIHDAEGTVGIELKYLAKRYHGNIGGEQFRLRNHSAHDLRRYDVIKDIRRLERLNEFTSGQSFAVVLTNDPAFWGAECRAATVDAAFRIGEGRELSGSLDWAPHTGVGTKRNRENPIKLNGRYRMKWDDYSSVDGANGVFRFLVVEVRS